jgi:hypothetical protein
MKPLKIRNLRLYLALSCSVLPLHAVASEAGQEMLQALLSERYYEVEFFVFERPAIVDFATEENLTLDGPRTLPDAIRTQRLAPEALWDGPLDPLTRACLTFPTLTYELIPASEIQTRTGDLRAAVAPMQTPVIDPVLGPDPQLDFLTNLAEFERSLQANSQRWQPSENFLLARAANRISRRGLGRILFHGRWLQAVPPREAPDPIFVRAGERLNSPLPSHELIGSVGVTLGRYLHFKTDLYFHGPGLGLEPAAAGMNASGEGLLLSADAAVNAGGYMQISESRRMRSAELHYLDHPKLGLVVRIDPVVFPQSLLEQLETLETLEESTD